MATQQILARRRKKLDHRQATKELFGQSKEVPPMRKGEMYLLLLSLFSAFPEAGGQE